MERLKQFSKPLLAIVILALLGTSGFLYKKYHDSQTEIAALKQDPNAAAQKEIKDLVTKVGKLVVLPTGEDPTVATVTDPDKLKDQSFFTNAKVGDKILIYTNAKKAYLYNPDINKIVEIAPITIGPSTTPAAAPATKK